ncbi:hypothetical protein A0H81_06624 [Grifola frondosa]|uniref:Uncharacterized protein n=1 Tax=Grifola frondosa TaxID=5627 RepID=A0A1C7M8Z0_GRIFR|nr:hypothetical protein A0H81_06624 [Grifola frondosa]
MALQGLSEMKITPGVLRRVPIFRCFRPQFTALDGLAAVNPRAYRTSVSWMDATQEDGTLPAGLLFYRFQRGLHSSRQAFYGAALKRIQRAFGFGTTNRSSAWNFIHCRLHNVSSGFAYFLCCRWLERPFFQKCLPLYMRYVESYHPPERFPPPPPPSFPSKNVLDLLNAMADFPHYSPSPQPSPVSSSSASERGLPDIDRSSLSDPRSPRSPARSLHPVSRRPQTPLDVISEYTSTSHNDAVHRRSTGARGPQRTGVENVHRDPGVVVNLVVNNTQVRDHRPQRQHPTGPRDSTDGRRLRRTETIVTGRTSANTTWSPISRTRTIIVGAPGTPDEILTGPGDLLPPAGNLATSAHGAPVDDFEHFDEHDADHRGGWHVVTAGRKVGIFKDW